MTMNPRELFRRLGMAVLEPLLTRLEDERGRRLHRSLGRVGEHVRLRMPVVIYHPKQISVGEYVDIGEFVVLRGAQGLVIGSRVLIAASVVITTVGHPITPPRYGVNEGGPVTIEDDVWIGAGAVILPNVTIGRGAVVAAGAIVTRSVDANTIVAGNPARPIGVVPAASGASNVSRSIS